jgi:hypothetical protein
MFKHARFDSAVGRNSWVAQEVASNVTEVVDSKAAPSSTVTEVVVVEAEGVAVQNRAAEVEAVSADK